jgi:prolyl oligopeptidase
VTGVAEYFLAWRRPLASIFPCYNFRLTARTGDDANVNTTTEDGKPAGMAYPPSRVAEQVDDYHGTLVPDPYRWLEDADSVETQAWIRAQNELTFAYLSTIACRQRITRRLTEMWDYPKMSAPFKRGGRYFQFRNKGLQNQDVLYVLEAAGDAGRVLLDPNTLSTDGTVALSSLSVSEDGRLLAYATAASGSDWQEWRVRDIASGQDTADLLRWSKFSTAAWLHDGSGFYYGRYAAPAAGEALAGTNYNQQLYLHRIGTDQSDDTLVYERPDHKDWIFAPSVSDDGRYLVLHVGEGTDSRNRVFYQELAAGPGFVELIGELEAAYDFVGSEGSRFYFRTDLDSSRGRLIAIDTTAPEKPNWRSVIPESDDVLENVAMARDRFVAVYLHHAHHRLRVYDLEGRQLGDIATPGISALLALNAHRDDDEIFYAFHSFTIPPTNYRGDLSADTATLLESPAVEFDAGPYQTRQAFVTAKDGTRVPLFLVHRRDMPYDGSNPGLLYGYGGFDIPMTPSFVISWAAWLELGGVLAVASLRGGGEYGEKWHRGGMLDKKQNVFDDFIACAEYLIAQRISSPQKLAIQGRSNGGLLVGACLTQRPELFGAALPAVGVLDMLRFHKFTNGWAWVSDYGSAEDPEQFQTLFAYSPLHNIRPGAAYPPTLIYTADHDDRVVPGHSFKFAATLQAAQGGEGPILIRIDSKAGHGMGKPTSALIAEQADNWAFLAHALGMHC